MEMERLHGNWLPWWVQDWYYRVVDPHQPLIHTSRKRLIDDLLKEHDAHRDCKEGSDKHFAEICAMLEPIHLAVLSLYGKPTPGVARKIPAHGLFTMAEYLETKGPEEYRMKLKSSSIAIQWQMKCSILTHDIIYDPVLYHRVAFWYTALTMLPSCHDFPQLYQDSIFEIMNTVGQDLSLIPL